MSIGNGCLDSSQGLRIGFVEQRDFWDFKLTGPFSVFDERGEAILKNVPPTFRCRIQLENWQPAKFEYQILIGRFFDKSSAREAEYKLIEKGVGAMLRRIGGKHIHSNKIVQDTTEYWLVVDQMKSEQDAQEFAKERLPGIPYTVIRQKISEPHALFNLLDHTSEKLGESQNLIRVVPENANTKVFLYHLTREGSESKEFERYAKLRGVVEFRCLHNDLIGAISTFPVEDYVENIVALNYADGMPVNALKALSVAVRSKALSGYCVRHENEPYDICNKSHCQTFEGYREIPDSVKKIIRSTTGEVLFRKKRIVQAEMTAVCGGHTESASLPDRYKFELDYPPVFDSQRKQIPKKYSDLSDETTIRSWIDEFVDANCDLNEKADPAVVSVFQPDFRWSRFYASDELGMLIEKKIGRSIGAIFAIILTKRSLSGRVQEMEILAADTNLVLKGETEIRQIFGGVDELPGACFYVENQMDEEGFPISFTFHGAGRGHGAGLCIAGSIGLAQNGVGYKEILSHYFRGTTLKKIYGE
ncbi:MAG: SpoIID/LytB domain-containing protein [Calditrichaeota bacterium]|nr:SpoIID/LytB domain-containing protein [Calditrichota bacterium]